MLTFADFTGTKEADIEDCLAMIFHVELVNAEYGSQLTTADLKSGGPRVLARMEKHFIKTPLPKGAVFNHFRPARLLAEKMAKFPIPDLALDRFGMAFKQLNSLLSG